MNDNEPDYEFMIKASDFNRARTEMYYAGAFTAVAAVIIIGIIFFVLYPY